MDFQLSEPERRFREDVQAFLRQELTEEVLEEAESRVGWGPASRRFIAKLGQKGWLTVTWPRAFGGLGGTHLMRLLATDELAYSGAPHTFIGASMAGPVILLFGTEEQKKRYLPEISRGEVEYALGYTEPQAGSDLASLEMRADEDGDCYVVNGQKAFNTACHYAQYHWLGARTDQKAPKHQGISLFVVPMDSPGITVQPLTAMDGHRTNAVFYDNVRVPRENLIGQKNRGFQHIATALSFERMTPTGDLRAMLESLMDYARQTRRDGRRVSEHPLVRLRLARLTAEIEMGRLLSYKVALMLDRNEAPMFEASMLKLWTSELRQGLSDAALAILGPSFQLSREAPQAALGGRAQQQFYDAIRRTITGGTSEIQRTIIATRGLGLPRG